MSGYDPARTNIALDTLTNTNSHIRYTYQECSRSFWSVSGKHQISDTITLLANEIILSLKINQMPGLEANRLRARKPAAKGPRREDVRKIIRVSFQYVCELGK
jgi:hypothetical protein